MPCFFYTRDRVFSCLKFIKMGLCCLRFSKTMSFGAYDFNYISPASLQIIKYDTLVYIVLNEKVREGRYSAFIINISTIYHERSISLTTLLVRPPIINCIFGSVY